MSNKLVDNKKRKDYLFLSLPIQIRYTYYFDQQKNNFGALYINSNIKSDLYNETWNTTYYNDNRIYSFGGMLGYAEEFREDKNNPKSKYVGGYSTALFAEYQVLESSYILPQNSVPDYNIKV